ncbi:MAG: hypothetical protein V4667_03065 [Bacteroidota bacterium]
METKKKSWFKRLGWTSIALCGLCCSLPIIGAALGIGALSAIAFYLEKIGFILLIAAIAFFVFAYLKKRRKSTCNSDGSCSIDCSCKTKTAQ